MLPTGAGAKARFASLEPRRFFQEIGVCFFFEFAAESHPSSCEEVVVNAHVAEWQTRTAQNRMRKLVEVRLLS